MTTLKRRFSLRPPSSLSYEKLLSYHFPRKYLESSWERVPLEDKGKAITEFLSNEHYSGSQVKGIFICGDFGIGKSALLSLIAIHIYSHLNVVPIYARVPDLCSPNCSNEHYDTLMKSSYLFLDDLGWEYSTEFSIIKLNRIVEYRYSQLLPTFVACNMTLKDLGQRAEYSYTVERFKDKSWMKYLEIIAKNQRY